MRPIKFREWETERKTMSYSKREDFDDMVGFRFDHEEGGKRILMQYTGLTDKSGKEIYEGDIDIDIDNGNLSVVKYLKKYGAYCFVPMELYLYKDYKKEVNYEYGYDCYFHNVTPSKYADIIGNIYEDKHLLEVQT